jgi:hypothetical protein
MRLSAVSVLIAIALWLPADPLWAQARPAPEPPRAVAPADELKLDESGALKASAIQSKMSAILANFALLQRQAQDLQQEMTKVLEERKKLLEDSARRARVEVREATEWVYDEANHRYIRQPRKP